MTLQAGDPAPAVSAANQDGEQTTVPVDGPAVLYFYPRDNTRGCTMEATQFDADLDQFREAGVEVYGVSVDSVDSHCEFAREHDLGLNLLADPDRELADAYDVPEGPAGTTGRTTFLISNGKIRRVYESVRPGGHASEVLSDLLEAGIADVDR